MRLLFAFLICTCIVVAADKVADKVKVPADKVLELSKLKSEAQVMELDQHRNLQVLKQAQDTAEASAARFTKMAEEFNKKNKELDAQNTKMKELAKQIGTDNKCTMSLETLECEKVAAEKK